MLQLDRVKVAPDYAPHKTLEDEVTEYLIAKGFFVFGDGTYHNSMPPELVRVLSGRYSPTALYLRGRADRIAVHKYLPIEFEWEAKTHLSRKYPDIAIEALPLIHHIVKATLLVKCLYVYANPYTQFQCGFWCDAIPPVAKVFIPARWQGARREFFKAVCSKYFPTAKLIEPDYAMGGSGDPFVIIRELDAIRLPHWKTEIEKSGISLDVRRASAE